MAQVDCRILKKIRRTILSDLGFKFIWEVPRPFAWIILVEDAVRKEGWP